MEAEQTWDDWAQRVYLTWLARDVRFAQVALTEVRARIDRTPPDPLLWIALETFLMYTAKVSKMLKPIQPNKPPKDPEKLAASQRREVRGDHLRHILEVGDDSPVLRREVRDANEHFDERLDDWIAKVPRPSAEEIESGARSVHPPAPVRRLDPLSAVVEVAGERLDLETVEVELARILQKAASIEVLATVRDPGLATLIAGFPPFPPELRLEAPTRRPDENVLTGVDPETLVALEQEWTNMWQRGLDATDSSDTEAD